MAELSSNTAIHELMQNAVATIKKVSNKFSKDPLSTSYIQFKMNNLNVCTATAEKDGFHNLVVSLSNEKTGSGCANKFRLVIAYAPQMGETFDINKVDRNITQKQTTSYTVSSMYCELTYGYADAPDLRTVTYKGLVLDYDVDFQEGMLVYTIIGYSGITAVRESKTPIKVETDEYGKIRPTEAVEQIVKKYLQSSGSDAIGSGINYNIEFDTDTNGHTIKGTDAPVRLVMGTDKNVAKAIDDILKKAVPEESAADTSTSVADTNKVIYSWYISDIPNGDYTGTVYVTRDDPTEAAKADADIVFNWMSPGAKDDVNFLVKSFQPHFRGSQLLALAQSAYNPRNSEGDLEDLDQEELYTGSYFVKDDGTVGTANESSTPVPGGDVETVNANIESSRATWVQAMQYPYSATMVLQGIPAEIPLTGLIKVVPLIYGQPHHSAGVYMITSCTDNIDSGGFLTTLELMKMDTVVELKDQQNTIGDQRTSNSTGWQPPYSVFGWNNPNIGSTARSNSTESRPEFSPFIWDNPNSIGGQ